MPLSTAIAAHRVTADAFVTTTELMRSPNFVLAYIRERIREEMADRIRDLTLQVSDVEGGKRYQLDVLVLTPTELVALVEREARVMLKRLGYADA